MNSIQIDPRAMAYVRRTSRKYGESESETINKMLEEVAQCREFNGYDPERCAWDDIEEYGYFEDRFPQQRN